MALHYDSALDRFRDESGHFVSYERGIRSSIAREEYYAAEEIREKIEEAEDEGMDLSQFFGADVDYGDDEDIEPPDRDAVDELFEPDDIWDGFDFDELYGDVLQAEAEEGDSP